VHLEVVVSGRELERMGNQGTSPGLRSDEVFPQMIEVSVLGLVELAMMADLNLGSSSVLMLQSHQMQNKKIE
jgi:hypothetical protein